jgi:hypothetical protein
MNSASAAKTWKTSRPPGVVVSRASCSLLPMTDAEIRAAEQAATSPARRLIVALAAVHAARWAAIRDLTLDDLDLPSRRITIAGHRQRLGELTYPGRCGRGSAIAAPPGRARPTGTS